MNPSLLRLGLLCGVLIQGCGHSMAPRPTGPYQALRLVRDLPAFTRIQDQDFEQVSLRPESLPEEKDLPRAASDVRGRTSRVPLTRGTFLRDSHLILQPVLPDPGHAHLEVGEWGMFARIEGLPQDFPEGSWLRLKRIPIPLRLAAVGIPSLESRPALLAAREEDMLRIARQGLSLPLNFEVRVDCGKTACPKPQAASKPPTSPLRPDLEARQPVVVARRGIAARAELQAEDLQAFPFPKDLLPPDSIQRATEAQGRFLSRPLARGELLTQRVVAESLKDPDPVDLAVDGLHPDWVHPGSRVFYLRCTETAEPLELEVLDMKRGVRGGPVPLKVRPVAGKGWPRLGRSGRRPKHGEGDLRAWVVLVRRSPS